MTLQQDVEALKNIPIFAKLEPTKLKLLAFTSEHIEFMSGDVLCQQGEQGDAAYILLEGEADIMVDTPDGPVKVASLGRNDIVGEIAILCDVPRTASVVAASHVSTLQISKENFFKLVMQFPHLSVEIMHELASRLYQTTQQLTEVSSRLRQAERSCKGTE